MGTPWVVAATLAALMAFAQRSAAATNLLDNGGFEVWTEATAPQSWTYSPVSASAAASGQARSGSWALAFTHASTSLQEIGQVIDLSGDGTYEAEAFCVTADANLLEARLRLVWSTVTGEPLAESAALLPLGTSGYERTGIVPGIPPPGAARVRVGLATRTAGVTATLVCDDISLTVTPLPTGTPVATPTVSPGPSPTATLAALPTGTPTSTAAAQATGTATATAVPSPSPSATLPPAGTATPTPTATPTITPSPTASVASATPSAVGSASPQPTAAVLPSRTPTPVPTVAPTATAALGVGGGPGGGASVVATGTATPVATATRSPAGSVIISEVMFNAPAAGRDAAFEWLEVENRSGTPVDLRGWSLADNFRTDELGELVVPGGSLALIVASVQAVAGVGAGVPVLVVGDGAIGNGLANGGDRIRLLDPAGAQADGVSWGTDRTVSDPPCPALPTGHSLQRLPGLAGPCPFQGNPVPSPGRRNSPPPAAATPTTLPVASPNATATPLPQPPAVATFPQASAAVSAAGGGVGVLGGATVEGGVTLTLPAEAVLSVVMVSLSKRTADASGLPLAGGGVALPWRLEVGAMPDGTRLRRSARLDVRLTAGEAAGLDLRRVHAGRIDAGGSVHGVPIRIVDVGRGIVQVGVDRLGTYVLYEPLVLGPVIAAPAEGVTLAVPGTTLAWDLPPGTQQYQVQVEPFGGDGPGIDLVRPAETRFAVPVPDFGESDPNYVMLPGMGYLWRVRTTGSTGVAGEIPAAEWSAWSVATFRTPRPAPGSVAPLTPVDGAEVTIPNPTLVWGNTDKSIFYYEVQLSADADFGDDAPLYWELRHGAVTDPPNSYRIPEGAPLEPGRRYFWRVRPRIQGDGEPAPWSEPSSFNAN